MEGRHPLALEMVEAPPRPCVTVQHAQILVQRKLAIGEPVMRTGQNRQAAVHPWSARLPQPEINSSRDHRRLCYSQCVSTDTKAIIGTIIGTGLVIAGLLLTQIAGVNNRINDVNNRMDRIEVRLDGFGERLRNVEVTLGKVVQRLLTIERAVLPAPAPGR